ncbi:ABC transporter permease [Clostridiales bacterium COT073_COT-073]|nr:ABC transporter permease [Clostridiales bacterium COT073_COT-073]
MAGNKKKKTSITLPHYMWLSLSIVLAIILWIAVSKSEGGSVMFADPWKVFQALIKKAGNGTLWPHIQISLFRVISGFSIAFAVSIPVAFLMAWYKPFRYLVEPWIQFIRNIPPLAYIPLIVLGSGVGEKSKVIVIFIAAFLTLVITIYQGVLNVDQTLIKAAKVLGANDRDIFFKIIIPASTPYILIGTRLGLSASLTTLIAAELTGASKGLGIMTQQASAMFERDVLLLGIILIGVLGITFEKIVKTLERKLTGWQEKIQ